MYDVMYVSPSLTVSAEDDNLSLFSCSQYSGSLQHKETHMAQLNMELTDHIKEIKEVCPSKPLLINLLYLSL